jgi:hypothetical protein
MSEWFTAHIILCLRYLDGEQGNYPVMENIVLIEASTSEEAWLKAERKGQTEAIGSECTTRSGRRAVWEFAGIRKVMKCLETFDPGERSEGSSEENGTEVSHSSFSLDSEDSLRKLVNNESVSIVYESAIDP